MEEVQEFPKMLYLNGDAAQYRIVNSREEEDEAGEEWIDAIIDPELLK